MLIIARVDDEQESLDIAGGAFQTFFKSLNQDVDIKGYTNGSIFLDSLKDTQYDLVCLDIIRKPIDGIGIASERRKKDSSVPLIFISSNETRVFSCFNFNPIGFIRKTNFFSDTKTILHHYVQDVLPYRKQPRKYVVKSHGDTLLLPIDEIRYIESNHNYQAFYRKNSLEPIEVRKLISDLENDLAQYGFIRVHKGFLVNYKYIYKFTASSLTLKNKKMIPLSRQNRDKIVAQYRSLTKDRII